MSEALTVQNTETAEQTAQETAAILADYHDANTDTTQGYKRVTPEIAGVIRRLRRLGKTQVQIADAIGMSQGTVSSWLRALSDDSTEDARQLAKNQALTATLKLVKQIDDTDPRVSQGAAKGIVAIAGVTVEQQVQVGVQVVLGGSGQPAGYDPLARKA